MRVLIDYRPALRDRSGVGESTHQLVKALLRTFRRVGGEDALEVTIFSSSWKDRLDGGPELAGVLSVDRRVPVKVLNFAWHRLGWPSIETLAHGVFDVAHSAHPLLMPSRGAARVVTIHDLDFLKHPERTRAEIRRDYPSLVRDHAHRADRIIVPSRFTASEVARHLDVPAEHIAVCPHGAPDWAAREHAPADGYILFFGTLEPRKNVAGLLDAYERLIASPAEAGRYERREPARHEPDRHEPDRHDDARRGGVREGISRVPELVLAGKAGEDAQPLLERIGRPPLAGRVRHIGYVNPGERRALYEEAALLVQPSFEEGFGMPVLEAMATGVPVVASERGALPEVLGDAGALVDPENADALAAAMTRMLDDDGYRAAAVSKGVLRARHFSWERTARLVFDAYGEAIQHRRERQAGRR